MEIDIQINNTGKINYHLGYVIIPFLYTDITKTQSLFDLINKSLNAKLADKYKPLLAHIENNIKDKNITFSTLTVECPIEKPPTKHNSPGHSRRIFSNLLKSSATKTRKQVPKIASTTPMFGEICELVLVVIQNKSFSNKNDDELMECLRITGNMIYSIAKSHNINKFNLVDSNLVASNLVASNLVAGNNKYLIALLEGLILSAYKFEKYKTSNALNAKRLKYKLQQIIIASNNKNKTPIKQLLASINQLRTIIKSVFLARDLINEPANKSKSQTFINIITKFIKDNKIPVQLEIKDKKELQKLGMGLILGVGQASNSANEPKLLILKYITKECKTKAKTKIKDNINNPAIVLLGKGITYDTGGLDLKSGKSMVEMKTDLSGAATVLSFLCGYAMSGGNKCITAICPFAENSIGPDAIKPSDVITAYNGKTVEITNTDAEGRLVLADCLAYAVEKYPKALLIDFATLTGQQEAVSGKLFSNILSVNASKETRDIITSSHSINELLVELPLVETQLHKLESYIADIKNVNYGSSADIIMSALFMRQFIKKDTKWIHIDIAGPSFKLDDVVKYASPEASGIGVRLLFEYLNI